MAPESGAVAVRYALETSSSGAFAEAGIAGTAGSGASRWRTRRDGVAGRHSRTGSGPTGSATAGSAAPAGGGGAGGGGGGGGPPRAGPPRARGVGHGGPPPAPRAPPPARRP